MFKKLNLKKNAADQVIVIDVKKTPLNGENGKDILAIARRQAIVAVAVGAVIHVVIVVGAKAIADALDN